MALSKLMKDRAQAGCIAEEQVLLWPLWSPDEIRWAEGSLWNQGSGRFTLSNKALAEERAQSVTNYLRCFHIWRWGGIISLGSALRQMKPNLPLLPKQSLNGLQGTLPGSVVGQESRARSEKTWGLVWLCCRGTCWPWFLYLSVMRSWTGDNLPLKPTLAPTMTLPNRWGHGKEGNKIFWFCLLFCPLPFLHMPQITLIRQLINSHPLLQSRLQLSEFHACLMTAAAAALLKPHPSPSSWGLLTSHSLPWPELPLRQLPPETATHMQSSSWSASLKQIQLARGASQVVKTKEFHSIVGILMLTGPQDASSSTASNL